MKSIKVLFALTIAVCMFSCDDSDGVEIGSVALTTDPTFTVTGSSENPGLFFFENTTPGKEDFYSYWEISDEGGKLADNGVLEYEFGTSGAKNITLTMVGTTAFRQSTESFTVTLPPPPDDRFLINPENLLLNAYMAEGDGDDFTNWGKFNGADRVTSEAVETLVGSRALNVSNPVDGNPWETQFVSDAVATEDGEDYTVSLWIKGDPVVVRFSTNPGVGGDQYGGDYTANADWTQYAFTFTANSATTLIALDMGATGGNFYVDAIEMVKGNQAIGLPSNDSALLNGGLEEGDGADFTNWGKFNGADRFSEETDDVLSGSRAANIVNGVDGNPWETQFVSDGFATENGADYTVSVWMKGDPVVVRFSTNPGVGGDQYAGDYTVTADWSQYSYTFTANSDTTLIALDMGATAGTFIIDNIKAVKN